MRADSMQAELRSFDFLLRDTATPWRSCTRLLLILPGSIIGHMDSHQHGAGSAAAMGHADHTDQGAHAGHDKHAGHSVAMFRDKFWLSLALTIPVVLLSPDIATWLGYSLPDVPLGVYFPAVLG